MLPISDALLHPESLFALFDAKVDRFALLVLLALTLFFTRRRAQLHQAPRAEDPQSDLNPNPSHSPHSPQSIHRISTAQADDLAAGRELRIAAFGLLACLAIWPLSSFLAWTQTVPSLHWSGPSDRLIGTMSIVSLAWLMAFRHEQTPRLWRWMLGSGFVAMLLAYTAWAPEWAYALSAEPPNYESTALTSLPRYWDAAQASLALFVGLAFVLLYRNVPRWLAMTSLILFCTSVLDYRYPMGLSTAAEYSAPLWTRLGLVGSAGLMALAASTWPKSRPNVAGHSDQLAEALAAWRSTFFDRFDAARSSLQTKLLKHAGAAKDSSSKGRSVALDAGQDIARNTEEARGPASSAYGQRLVYEALDDNSHAIAQLSQGVERLATRLDRMETALADARLRSLDPEAAGAGASGADSVRSDGALNTTERDRTAEQESTADPIEARLRRYEESLEHMPLGVLVTDDQGRIAIANPRAQALLSEDESPLRGRDLAAVFGPHPKVASALRETLAGQRPTLPIELEGRPFHLEIFDLRPPPDDAIIGWLAVLRPLELPNESADSAKEELVPELIKAIRTPMNLILGYSDMIRRTSLDFPKVKRYLVRIDANLERLQFMLDNLTSLSPAAEPQARAFDDILGTDDQFESDASAGLIDLQATLGYSLKRSEHRSEDKGLSFDTHIERPLAGMRIETTVILRILDNLIAFATQRSPQGGDIEITAKPADSVLEEGSWMLSIQDRGPAIAPSENDTHRLDLSLLGIAEIPVELKLVTYLAEDLGGRVQLINHGLGVTVQVILPATTLSAVME